MGSQVRWGREAEETARRSWEEWGGKSRGSLTCAPPRGQRWGGDVLRGHGPQCSQRCPVLTLSRGGKMRCWLVPNSSRHVLRWKPSETRCQAGGASGQGREPGLRPRPGDATERDHPRPPARPTGLGTRPPQLIALRGVWRPAAEAVLHEGLPPRCSGSHGRCEPAKNRWAGPQWSHSRRAPCHQGPAGITASAPPDTEPQPSRRGASRSAQRGPVPGRPRPAPEGRGPCRSPRVCPGWLPFPAGGCLGSPSVLCSSSELLSACWTGC